MDIPCITKHKALTQWQRLQYNHHQRIRLKIKRHKTDEKMTATVTMATLLMNKIHQCSLCFDSKTKPFVSTVKLTQRFRFQEKIFLCDKHKIEKNGKFIRQATGENVSANGSRNNLLSCSAERQAK